MNARYTVSITRKEAENFLKVNIGNVRLPAGAKYLWVGGVHTVTDQPGVYLVAAAGGSCGVVVLAPASEQESAA